MSVLSEHNQPKQSGTRGFLREVVEVALIAILIVLPIRMFIAQPFIVSGASMQPTFSSGDYLVVDQISKRFEPLQRQEVIIFRYPKDPDTFFIKRIIGLPNETVQIQNGDVFIYNDNNPNGFKLNEPYVTQSAPNTLTKELGANEYFVMGDNRQHSSDSRSWGALTKKDIIGRAFTRLFPPDEITLYPGHIQKEQ
jgi:signal peptidase I